ncbi:MAG: endonuclease domain-containing protein [Betaproteobacteria bacterium]|nr:endonuclease domain-containing protein [Betaproteobacteria bacterium]
MRSKPTDVEARLWMQLRAGQLQGLKFKRQVPIGNYIADFVCFASKLIVEVDGGQHNGSKHDEIRDAWLRSQGFVVLRYWNNDVLCNMEGVLTDILHHATPSPSVPLPRGEREAKPSRRSSRITESPSPLVGEGLGRGGGSLARKPPPRESQP